jgi:DNA repair exonuclease SbcCD ATPase subunit
MSKALELLANIDKKYNSELQNIEEQLLNGIEQTSQTIKDSLSTRANITATAIQQSDEKLVRNIRDSSQQVEKQLEQYQALLQSKLSRLKQMNEQIQTEEQQVQNKSLLKQLTTLNMALILGVAILIMLIIALGFMGKSKYSEIRTLNMAIDEKQMRVDHLNRSGGSLTFSTCKQPNSKAQRLCIQINKDAGEWQNNFMVPMGY